MDQACTQAHAACRCPAQSWLHGFWATIHSHTEGMQLPSTGSQVYLHTEGTQVSSAEQEVSCSGSSMQGHFDAIAELINSSSISNADRQAPLQLGGDRNLERCHVQNAQLQQHLPENEGSTTGGTRVPDGLLRVLV